MQIDWENREDQAAQAIRRSRAAFDQARRSAERPRFAAESILTESLRAMHGESAKPFAPIDVRSGRPSLPLLATADSSAAKLSQRMDLIDPPRADRKVEWQRELPSPRRATAVNPILQEMLVSNSNRATSSAIENDIEASPDDSFASDSALVGPSDSLQPQLDRFRDELRQEMQTVVDQLRADAARYDSARLVAMQM